MRRVALAFLCVGCASASVPARARRTRPGGVVVYAALEAVTPLAQRCLQPGDRVTVDGFFDGPTGWYRVERVGTASPRTRVAVQQCVALEMEAARVRPFTAERRDATWTVNASNASMTMLEEVSAGSIANIDTLPTSSVYTDPSTGRSFVRRISVTNLGDAGPSGGVSARRVAISVEWSSHALSGGGSVMSDGGTGHVETLTAIVSEVIDGGT